MTSILITTVQQRVGSTLSLLHQIAIDKRLRSWPVYVVASGFGRAAADQFAAATETSIVADAMFFRDLPGPFTARQRGLQHWRDSCVCVLDDDMQLTRYSNLPSLSNMATSTDAVMVGHAVPTSKRADVLAANLSDATKPRYHAVGPLVGTGPMCFSARAVDFVLEIDDAPYLHPTAVMLASCYLGGFPIVYDRYSMTVHAPHAAGAHAWGCVPGRVPLSQAAFSFGPNRRHQWAGLYPNSTPEYFSAAAVRQHQRAHAQACWPAASTWANLTHDTAS